MLDPRQREKPREALRSPKGTAGAEHAQGGAVTKRRTGKLRCEGIARLGVRMKRLGHTLRMPLPPRAEAGHEEQETFKKAACLDTTIFSEFLTEDDPRTNSRLLCKAWRNP